MTSIFGELKAARDNLIWEHGLFSGKNGRDRTFIVMPRDVSNLKLPTDWLGVTPATYDSSQRKVTSRPPPARPVSTSVRQSRPPPSPMPSRSAEAPPPLPAPAPASPAANQSALRGSPRNTWPTASPHGTAGLSMAPSDPAKANRPPANALDMARDVFLREQSDAYAIWLRPDTSKPPELVGYSVEGRPTWTATTTSLRVRGWPATRGHRAARWSLAVMTSPRNGGWSGRAARTRSSVALGWPVRRTGGVLGRGLLQGVRGHRRHDVADTTAHSFASLLGFVVQRLPCADSGPLYDVLRLPG